MYFKSRDLKLVHNHRLEKEPDLEYEIDHCIEQRYSNSNTWTNQVKNLKCFKI